MSKIIGAAVLAFAVAACGGGDDDDDATATTEPESASIDVQVTAEQILGCTESTARSGLDIGNGSRVTVEDESGTVLGTGTFDLTSGAEACDWTATIDDVDPTADFYRFDTGGELATVSRAELEQAGWDVRVHIGITGSANLESIPLPR